MPKGPQGQKLPADVRQTIERERTRVPLLSAAGRHVDWKRALGRL
jgi:hypothetical protein